MIDMEYIYKEDIIMDNIKRPIPIALSLSINQAGINGMKGIYFPIGLAGEGFMDN